MEFPVSVKTVSKLRRKRYRDTERLFLAEGPQAVREALEAEKLTKLYVEADARSLHSGLIDHAVSRGVTVSEADAKSFASLTETVTPQGLVGVCSFVDIGLDDAVNGAAIVAVADHIRDPGNAGALLRVADAAGVDAVVFTHASVDPYNGKCVRASTGSIFHVPIVRGAEPDLVVSALRAAGMRVVTTSSHAAMDLFAVAEAGELTTPVAWLFGNEAHGVTGDLARYADVDVRIPIYGKAESLNLATAAALCLYESVRSRG